MAGARAAAVLALIGALATSGLARADGPPPVPPPIVLQPAAAWSGPERAAVAAVAARLARPIRVRAPAAMVRDASACDADGDPRAGADADVYAWLRDAGAIESYLSTLANEQAEAREQRARRVRVRAVADDLAAALGREATTLARREDERATGLRLQAALAELAASDPAARLAGYRALADLAPVLSGADVQARVRRLALLVSEARYDVVRMKQVPGLRDALLFVDADRPIDVQPYLGRPRRSGPRRVGARRICHDSHAPFQGRGERFRERPPM